MCALTSAHAPRQNVKGRGLVRATKRKREEFSVRAYVRARPQTKRKGEVFSASAYGRARAWTKRKGEGFGMRAYGRARGILAPGRLAPGRLAPGRLAPGRLALGQLPFILKKKIKLEPCSFEDSKIPRNSSPQSLNLRIFETAL